MSDLFCAATVIVARHAEATYERLGMATDDGGWLTDLGRKQAVELAESLAGSKIAAIWCSDMSRAVQTAEIVASRLPVPVRVFSGLREVSVGGYAGRPDPDIVLDTVLPRWLGGELTASAPDAEDGNAVIERMTSVLDGAADQFRGETLLVISHGDAMSLALPALARNVPLDFARDRDLPNATICELSVDADGWVLRTWAGNPV